MAHPKVADRARTARTEIGVRRCLMLLQCGPSGMDSPIISPICDGRSFESYLAERRPSLTAAK